MLNESVDIKYFLKHSYLITFEIIGFKTCEYVHNGSAGIERENYFLRNRYLITFKNIGFQTCEYMHGGLVGIGGKAETVIQKRPQWNS